MRTAIAKGIIYSQGSLAAWESVGRNQETEKFIREKKQELMQQARKYLSKHPKASYYAIYGYMTDADGKSWTSGSDDSSRLIAYTDEEVLRIKKLFLMEWNKKIDDSSRHAKSYEDIPQDELIRRDFEAANSELDELVWNRAYDEGFTANHIDLCHPVHAYRFSAWEYDRETDEMSKIKIPHLVVLTDDEYLYLLTEQLYDRYFSFNRLLRYNAHLAQKISNATDGDYMTESFCPYLILMDEVVEDMQNIIGQDDELNRCRENEINEQLNRLF